MTSPSGLLTTVYSVVNVLGGEEDRTRELLVNNLIGPVCVQIVDGETPVHLLSTAEVSLSIAPKPLTASGASL